MYWLLVISESVVCEFISTDVDCTSKRVTATRIKVRLLIDYTRKKKQILTFDLVYEC